MNINNQYNKPIYPHFQFVTARIAGYIRELISLIACIALYIFRQTYFEPKQPASNQQPILLVHGYLHNSSGWIYHRRRLKKAGFSNVFTVDLGALPTKSIAQYAEVLQRRIAEIAKITGRKDIRLIGHSMGGVVSAYYATHLAEKNAVDVTDVITLLAPLRGTKLHVIGVGPCVRDMAYESDFSKTLSSKINGCTKTRFFHIASKADLIIFPYTSALNYPPCSEPEKSANISIFPHLGHAAALFSKSISNIIIQRLQNNIRN